MSSIKLSPNASGTGIFTVAAPNSASNYTLTLPTETGTVLTNAGPFTANASASAGAVTIDASNNVGIGTSSPNRRLHVQNGSSGASNYGVPGLAIESSTNVDLQMMGSTTGQLGITFSDSGNNQAGFIYYQNNGDYMQFATNGSERARIDSSGRLLAGYNTSVNTNALLQGFCNNSTVSTPAITWASSSGYLSGAMLVADNQGWSAAACAMVIGKTNSTNRSISAAGTLNASGADYAEYMVKAGDFTIAKGDVCGIDANGKLTNVFADAVSFVVKSTNPSYVGGDIWGSEDAVGAKKPDAPADNATEEEKAAYATDFAEWEAKFNAERAKVDRIAFSGQVPVNVMGATPGQYIVPADDNGGIKGVAKSEADMSLAEYMRAVGKVIAVEADGRAKIIVKVA